MVACFGLESHERSRQQRNTPGGPDIAYADSQQASEARTKTCVLVLRSMFSLSSSLRNHSGSGFHDFGLLLGNSKIFSIIWVYIVHNKISLV